MRVWNNYFFDDGVPQRRGLEVEIFLAVEGCTLDRVVWTCGWAYVGEARDAEDDCCAAVEVGGTIGVAVLESLDSFFLEVVYDW